PIKPAISSHSTQHSSVWSTVHYLNIARLLTSFTNCCFLTSRSPFSLCYSDSPQPQFISRIPMTIITQITKKLRYPELSHISLTHLPSILTISALMTSLTPVTTPSSASVSPMALPASYAGDAAVCGGFLLQVDLFIEMQPQKFTTERSKVAFLISLLNGNALEWARAIWNAESAIINSYVAFKNHFKEVFGSTTGELSVSDQLLHLRQGSFTTREYTLQFRTLAATSGWNEAALLSAYRAVAEAGF
uniref:DUF4939 domain-containing protein n=1 Tax=Sinocyclocheilus anshuiensis TaxID=1608454 RepID=A0A671PX66_9TELE